MAKKEQQIIHPRVLLSAMESFQNDAVYALSTMRNALNFLTKAEHDPARVISAITPQMQEAVERLARWYE